MKKLIHKAQSRGFADHGWLQANHSFSFANWYNPHRLHFGALRVLNDDVIAPNMGFGTHPHDNMEIITIPLQGILKHSDNMNHNRQTVVPSEVQVMSAGTGIQHSEINGSLNEHLKLFQIWIIPNKRNVTPSYQQKVFNEGDRKGRLQTLVTSYEDTDSESLKIHQDVKLSRIDLVEGESFNYVLKTEKHGVYVMSISGKCEVEGEILETRDAIGLSELDAFKIISKTNCELLFIEVPMLKI
ncbi:pirin family protein [Winogradskyella endarachnes]|uniref:Pirin family protein n=1 Tax=Winogradskyella endarachnes TaxID=2681965 RepID=A0A6L6U8P2_9FLAO|nr:pirin family protein [Winogradskyella endarachnes]MUU77252.1 pirin family protein [Winogradskyella endarachnes]